MNGNSQRFFAEFTLERSEGLRMTGFWGFASRSLVPVRVGASRCGTAYAWPTVEVPANARFLAFDFTVTGDPKKRGRMIGISFSAASPPLAGDKLPQ